MTNLFSYHISHLETDRPTVSVIVPGGDRDERAIIEDVRMLLSEFAEPVRTEKTEAAKTCHVDLASSDPDLVIDVARRIHSLIEFWSWRDESMAQ